VSRKSLVPPARNPALLSLKAFGNAAELDERANLCPGRECVGV